MSEKAPKGCNLREWFAQRSDEDLFKVEQVRVRITENDLPGRPRQVAVCGRCGEQITDGREVQGEHGEILCRNCAQGSYYEVLGTI